MSRPISHPEMEMQMSWPVSHPGIEVQLQADGTVLSMPAKLAFGYRDGRLTAHGDVQSGEAHPVQMVRDINKEAAGLFGECLEKLAGALPKKLTFHYDGGEFLLCASAGSSGFGIVWKKQSLACLAAVRNNTKAAAGTLEYYISQAAGLFGVEQVYLYGRKGSGVSLPSLTRAVLGAAEELQYPARLNDCNVLFCGKFYYNKDKDLVGKFLHQVFGIENMCLLLFMGMGRGSFMGYAMLPALTGGVLNAKELYLGVECSKETQMVLSGTFQFSFIKDALFQVEGSVGPKGFTLEAFAKVEQPAVIYKGFKVGDTALAITVGADGTAFRLFCNLYIGEIKTFGAVGVSCRPGAVSMEFLSAAVSDITLPKLIKNLFGTGVTFADALDFLELSGLPLQGAGDVKIRIDKNADLKTDAVKEQVVTQFNRAVRTDSFALRSSGINLERIAGTTGDDVVVLTDQSRMRHYSIDSGGRLKLQAQFYYSVVDARFGDYRIRKGVFVCGSITLFKKFTFKALFSMSEEDGVLAYASVDSFHLGILAVEPSGIASADDPLRYFPKDSLLWLLMDQKPGSKPAGAVFFLRSGKQECSFYLDGKVRLFGIFAFAAKIIYTGKYISIDTRFNIGSLIQTTFQLKASYGDFTNLNFSVLLVVDCTGLEKKMRQAQDGINGAIQRLREKVDSANKKLTQAQRHVNELYSQIDTLDSRIRDCRRAISDAGWWCKAFVAIAKGAEILAYEVAKGGVYTAIGIANAALEVAKLAVRAFGAVGEGVMKLVNGVIDAALNLFFIKYIRLYAAASATGGCFQAEIEFVALGKTFQLKKEIGASSFLNDPGRSLDSSISDRLQPELNHIEDGSFKSNRRRYRKMQDSIQGYRRMFGQGMSQLESGTAVMQGMSQIYMDHCKEIFPEYEHLQESYIQALGEAEAAIAVTDDMADFQQMNEALQAVKSTMQDDSVKIKEENRQALEAAVREYEAAARLAEKMREDAQTVHLQRQDMQAHYEQLKAAEVQNLHAEARSATIPAKEAEWLLNDTEELLYTHFPKTRSRGDYINLSRESKILDSLDAARTRMGLAQSAAVRKNRSRSTPLNYKERL